MWALPEGTVPIYEYQCPDCGHQFEQLQKISDEPVRTCPQCNETHVKKLVSQTSFVLKGGGWYKDHYGLKSGGKSDSSESSASTATTAAPAASSDKPTSESKPAATESKPAATESKPTTTPTTPKTSAAS